MAINWFVVGIAVVVNMVVGTLWYGPLFGSLWLRLLGKTREEIGNSNNPLIYVIPIVGTAIAAVVLSALFGALGVSGWWQGLLWGFVVWFAFGATALLTTGVFEERPPGVALLFIAYQLVVYGAVGVFLAVL